MSYQHDMYNPYSMVAPPHIRCMRLFILLVRVGEWWRIYLYLFIREIFLCYVNIYKRTKLCSFLASHFISPLLPPRAGQQCCRDGSIMDHLVEELDGEWCLSLSGVCVCVCVCVCPLAPKPRLKMK